MYQVFGKSYVYCSHYSLVTLKIFRVFNSKHIVYLESLTCSVVNDNFVSADQLSGIDFSIANITSSESWIRSRRRDLSKTHTWSKSTTAHKIKLTNVFALRFDDDKYLVSVSPWLEFTLHSFYFHYGRVQDFIMMIHIVNRHTMSNWLSISFPSF